jgi:hypothetical protein
MLYLKVGENKYIKLEKAVKLMGDPNFLKHFNINYEVKNNEK